jgi:hypothetical protein
VTHRRLAAIGALAAVAASAGDLLMLWVANARRPELGLATPPDTVLWLGAALGVLGIPVYAVGYRAAARLVADHPRGARAVFAGGALAAGAGALVHGLTAELIDRALRSGTPGTPPLEAVAAGGPLLVGLWGLAALSALVASVAFARSRGDALALANPALVTVGLTLLALPTELTRSFLAPAAPNLAHIVFFLACARR